MSSAPAATTTGTIPSRAGAAPRRLLVELAVEDEPESSASPMREDPFVAGRSVGAAGDPGVPPRVDRGGRGRRVRGPQPDHRPRGPARRVAFAPCRRADRAAGCRARSPRSPLMAQRSNGRRPAGVAALPPVVRRFLALLALP